MFVVYRLYFISIRKIFLPFKFCRFLCIRPSLREFRLNQSRRLEERLASFSKWKSEEYDTFISVGSMKTTGWNVNYEKWKVTESSIVTRQVCLQFIETRYYVNISQWLYYELLTDIRKIGVTLLISRNSELEFLRLRRITSQRLLFRVSKSLRKKWHREVYHARYQVQFEIWILSVI